MWILTMFFLSYYSWQNLSAGCSTEFQVLFQSSCCSPHSFTRNTEELTWLCVYSQLCLNVKAIAPLLDGTCEVCAVDRETLPGMSSRSQSVVLPRQSPFVLNGSTLQWRTAHKPPPPPVVSEAPRPLLSHKNLDFKSQRYVSSKEHLPQ